MNKKKWQRKRSSLLLGIAVNRDNNPHFGMHYLLALCVVDEEEEDSPLVCFGLWWQFKVVGAALRCV